MKFASLFTGFDGAGIGAAQAGLDVVGGLEFDDAIAQVARDNGHDVLTGDVRCAPMSRHIVKADWLHASPPCFPAGVTVLTKRGLIPIEDVQVGDEVTTHKARWRRVSHVMFRQADTIILHGLGHHGLECTEDHPFLASEIVKTYPPHAKRKPGNYVKKHMAKPSWVPAKSMLNRHWLKLDNYPATDRPTIEFEGNEHLKGQTFDTENLAFWYVVGLWIGDGWVRYSDGKIANKKRGTVHICAGKHEQDHVRNALKKAGIRFYEIEQRTTVKFSVSSRPLCRWLTQNFGKNAHGKKLPAWLFGYDLDARTQLFRGYCFADGCKIHPENYKEPIISASTVSPRLAIGMRMLAETLGYSSTLKRYVRTREASIEGRSVNERPTYFLRFSISQRHSRHVSSFYRSGCVRSIDEGRKNVTVYDITVEEDESFIADGIVVHNCPNYSVAKRNAKETAVDIALASSIFYHVDYHRPRFFSLENVRGYAKSESFRLIRRELETRGYRSTTAIINSADLGVPQTRTRLFLVATLEGMPQVPRPTHAETPGSTLFGAEQLRWNGWYDAVADLLPGLAEAKLADWQYKRLPPRWKAALVSNQRDPESRQYYTLGPKAPARTVTAQTGQMRAVLISSHLRAGKNLAMLSKEQPAPTITGNADRQSAIITGTQAGSRQNPRDRDQPVHTVTASAQLPKAVIVDCRNAGRQLYVRKGSDPSTTVTVARSTRDLPLAVGTTVVRMSPRCVARFQGFSDDYVLPDGVGLSCKGVGNAVPPQVMRSIIEANLQLDAERRKSTT